MRYTTGITWSAEIVALWGKQYIPPRSRCPIRQLWSVVPNTARDLLAMECFCGWKSTLVTSAPTPETENSLPTTVDGPRIAHEEKFWAPIFRQGDPRRKTGIQLSSEPISGSALYT
jgi:hypothetical protein